MEPQQRFLGQLAAPASLCWLLWLLFTPTHLPAQQLVVDEWTHRTALTPHLLIYTDASNKLDIETLLIPSYQHQFAPLKKPRLRLDQPDVTTWISFQIAPGDPLKPNRLLYLGHALLNQADLFAVDGTGQIIDRQLMAPSLGTATHHHLTERLFLIKPSQQSITYYLRLRHPLPIMLDPAIWNPDTLLQKIEWFQWLSGAFFGLMTAVILFNGLLFFANREPANLYYGAFLLAMTLLQALIDGKIFRLILVDAQWQGRLTILAVLLTNYTALRFARVFLLQDARKGRWSQLTRLGEWTIIITALIGLFLPAPLLLYQLALYYSAGFTLFLLLLSLYRAQQGYRPAIYYFCGRMLLLPLLLLMILHALGGTDTEVLAGKGVMVVAAIEGIILSLALLHRLRQMEKWHYAERRQGERRQVETRARRKLVAKITQDLRAPLNGIYSMSELLADSRLDADEKNQARAIHQAAEKAIYLVDRAQNTVGLESDELQINVAEFNLRQLIDEVIAQIRLIADPSHITLITELDPLLAETALGDPRYIKQALVELISNAVNAIRSGEVRLTAEPLAEGTGVRFTVSDQGSGIPESIQQLLHLPVHQLLIALESHEESGLGLPIVKWLVTRMGGKLSFASRPGQGTSASFTLPATALLSPPLPTVPIDGSRLAGRRILIVEADETIRTSLLTQCKRWAMEAMAVSGSSQAIALLRDQSHLGKAFDFLLIDQESTSPSGLELAARVKQEALPHDPVIILLIGLGFSPTPEQTRHASIARVLVKPVPGAQLQRLLCDLLPREPIEFAPSGRHADTRVLIIDRDPINLNQLHELFARLKVSADAVSERSTLLQRVEQSRYDLILINHEPPLLDGIDLSQKIRAWELRHNRLPTPLIVLDSPGQSDTDWQSSGINERLVKPLDSHQLRHLLEQWVSG